MSLLLLLKSGGAPPSTNYQLTAQGGSYTLSGQSAVVSRNRNLTAQGGSYNITSGDPHWNQTVLAMHMDGANGSTTFTDLKGKTVTRSGDAQISTAQSKFGGASAYFDGASDYLSIADSDDFSFGTGDFTIECWAYPTNFSATRALISQRSAGDPNNYWGLRITATSGVVQFYVAVSGSVVLNRSTTAALTAGAWNHIAAVRSAGVLSIYINGVNSATGTNYSSFPNVASPVTIGMTIVTNTEPYLGYLDDLRVTKGVARYPADFTAPTAAFPENWSAVISRNRNLTANGGSYSLTGQSAGINRNRTLTAQGGTYSYTGQQVTITYAPVTTAYTLTAQGGSYSLTGQAATLLKSRLLTANAGNYSLTGQNATIKQDRKLTASGGQYSLTGQNAVVTHTVPGAYVLTCRGGSYTLTGQSAVIQYAGQAANQGGSAGPHKKKKRVFIEKDGELLIFDNATQAAQYVQAEKEQELAVKNADSSVIRPLRKDKKRKPNPEPQVIKIDALEGLIRHFRMANDLTEMIERQELDAILALQRKLWEMQDEEDVELLLLAA
jgi:hypothetical protein